MWIREYKPADCEELAELFYNTVHSINAKDYAEEHLNVWATGEVDLQEWNDSFLKHKTVVAVENNEIVGFGDIDDSGYLDRLYVHKDYQRMGIASAICNELESSVKVKTIATHASITAKPFFQQRGYQVVKEQKVIRQGIVLANYVMEKQIEEILSKEQVGTLATINEDGSPYATPIYAATAAWQENDETHWGRFVVFPTVRGKHIGTKLAKISFDELFDMGIDKIYMDAREATVKIVCGMGGHIVGKTYKFYEGNVTPVVLEKSDYIRTA